MAINNAVNANQAGVQCLTSAGIWNGRTITAGTGISVTNGDGVSGNPTISATGSGPGLGTVFVFDDFLGYPTFSSGNATGGKGNANLNYASSSSLNTIGGTSGSANNPGIIVLTVDASVGRGIVLYGNVTSSGFDDGDFILGNGECSTEWYIKIPTLSTAGTRFNVRCGIGNNLGAFSAVGDAPNHGCWFEYQDDVNSGNWTIKCKDGSGTTTGNTSTAADTNFHNMKVVVNAAATSVAFYIDGTQVANSPLSANIPTTTVSFFLRIYQVSGAAASRSVQCDFLRFIYTLTTPRSG